MNFDVPSVFQTLGPLFVNEYIFLQLTTRPWEQVLGLIKKATALNQQKCPSSSLDKSSSIVVPSTQNIDWYLYAISTALHSRKPDQALEVIEELWMQDAFIVSSAYDIEYIFLKANRLLSNHSERKGKVSVSPCNRDSLLETVHSPVMDFYIARREWKSTMSFLRTIRHHGMAIPTSLSLRLVQELVRAGHTHDALGWIEALEADGMQCPVDSILWQALIAGTCQRGQVDEACWFMDRMRCRSPGVSAYGFNPEISLRRVQKQLENIAEIETSVAAAVAVGHTYRYQTNAPKYVAPLHGRPDGVCWRNLIAGYCHASRFEEAFESLSHMTMVDGCEPTNEHFQVILENLGKTDEFVLANRAIELMVSRGCHPTPSDWKNVINSCINANKKDRVLNVIFKDMKEIGGRDPEQYLSIYEHVLSFFAKNNDVFNVVKILNLLKHQNVSPSTMQAIEHMQHFDLVLDIIRRSDN